MLHCIVVRTDALAACSAPACCTAACWPPLPPARQAIRFPACTSPWLQEALAAPDISTAICHLILDTVLDLGQAPWAAGASSQQHAAALLLQCCREQPRVAVNLAQAFSLTDIHLSATQQADLLDGISALLDANATSACGVSLLLHFPPLRRHFHLEAVIEDLVVSSQEPVAVRLVRELGRREMQVCGGAWGAAAAAAAAAAAPADLEV